MNVKLYRHFGAGGVLLYVGITVNAKRRLAEHKRRSRWAYAIERVTVEEFPNQASAQLAEKIAIEEERPLYNKVRAPSMCIERYMENYYAERMRNPAFWSERERDEFYRDARDNGYA